MTLIFISFICLRLLSHVFSSLPEWTKSVFPGGDMEWISSRSFATKTNTPQLARLKVGFLIKDILDRFKNRSLVEDVTPTSLYVYSAHDNTIGSVLNALGLFEVNIFRFIK